MIITQETFYREFSNVCRDSVTHSTCKLAIFVSCFNIDAICSARMLSEYFKTQFIVFQLIPVIGYIDMKEKYLKLDSEIQNIILIGCGATADLETFLEIDINDFLHPSMNPNDVQTLIDQAKLKDIRLNRKIYVIDGHRPWNLDNLYSSPMICCLDDNSTTELDSEREAFYYLINVEDNDSNEEGEGESEEEEIEDLATDNDEENNEEEDDELDLEDSLERKRKSPVIKESSKKKQKRLINEYQEIIENYYQQGSTISIPSSHQMYDLLSTIGEINLDFLWLAIIGSRSLRDVYKQVYQLTYPGLRDEVKRLQSDENSFNLRSYTTSNNSISNSRGSEMTSTNSLSLSNANISKKADNLSLQSCKEYTLFLLHHWTLYNSFYYSSYINSKCHLYTNEGGRLLKTMFARMGISLIQANQNWHYIDLELKKKLDDLIKRESFKFNLKDIIIDGFKRNYGFHGSITSGDYVESVQALLEYGYLDNKFSLSNAEKANKTKKKKKSKNNHGDDSDDDENNDNDDDEEDDDDDKIKNNERRRNEQFLQSFWRAYDSLNNYNDIIKGMEIAKFQQQFIFEKGSEIIQKGMVKTQSKFKVVILNESFTSNSSITKSNFSDSTFNKSNSSIKDDRVVDITSFGNGSQMFQNPLILSKLGNWILNIQAELEEGLLPLLIGAYNSESQTYLICGLPSRATFDDDDDEEEENDDNGNDGDGDGDSDDDDYDDNKKKRRERVGKRKNNKKKEKEQKVILNAFSVLFEKVTQEINIQARMDSFQSAIIELRKEDLTKFLDGLTRYSQYML
ncbi:DNA replication initiation factor [Pichia kluyveri]|uniref:DNA replication initiation factor n=1 Tax=Pichia kluyveri TaxID=36015 RepID=A0AAV5R2X3_PICKL|nr:DNA replication initiation factor [Pichia kluyveri]